MLKLMETLFFKLLCTTPAYSTKFEWSLSLTFDRDKTKFNKKPQDINVFSTNMFLVK